MIFDTDALFAYDPGGAEVSKNHASRIESGFYQAYLSGDVVLDIGNRGSDNPEGRTVVPQAIGVDLDYPGYDGKTLPFADGTVDAVFSSHAVEHFIFPEATIKDHFRVLKTGGYIVCIAPHQFLYEKKTHPPSRYNYDHKTFFTPSSLLALFERTLSPNSYRVRHMRDNDDLFDYNIGPFQHSYGSYEIELVLQKIPVPNWSLAE